MKVLDLTREYICDSCGAPLTIDEENQVLVCKFCGITHDYEYFLHEDSLFVGYTFLKKRNFKEALRTFNFILKREPHNVMALRGMLYATFEIIDFRDLGVAELTMTPEREKAIGDSIANAPEEYKEYFENFKESVELRIKVRESRLKVSELDEMDMTRPVTHYDTTADYRPYRRYMTFGEAFEKLYLSGSGLNICGLAVTIVDALGVFGLIVIATAEADRKEQINRLIAQGKRVSDTAGSKAGMSVFLILLVMAIFTVCVPFMVSITTMVDDTRRIERTVLKTKDVIVDTGVRDDMTTYQKEIVEFNERIREVNAKFRAVDNDLVIRSKKEEENERT